jgi:hypothetical protein
MDAGTNDRLALDETGKPWDIPLIRLHVPRAMNSWLGSIRYPCSALMDLAVRTLSE